MKFATRIARLLISAFLVGAAVAQPATELSAAEAPSLRIVYNALGGSMAPVWVAQKLGLFAKHGLQHRLNYLAATTAVQALVAGSEEIGLADVVKNPIAQHVQPEDFYDNSFVQKLEASGFINSLYAR